MPKLYVGVNNIARRTKRAYIGVNNIARRIKKIYVGDANNKARLTYVCYPITITLKGGYQDTINFTYNGQRHSVYFGNQTQKSYTFDLVGVNDVITFESVLTGFTRSQVVTPNTTEIYVRPRRSACWYGYTDSSITVYLDERNMDSYALDRYDSTPSLYGSVLMGVYLGTPYGSDPDYRKPGYVCASIEHSSSYDFLYCHYSIGNVEKDNMSVQVGNGSTPYASYDDPGSNLSQQMWQHSVDSSDLNKMWKVVAGYQGNGSYNQISLQGGTPNGWYGVGTVILHGFGED